MARDAFQLVQEAVANWESLEGVVGVDVVEQWLGNTTERGFMAKVALIDQADPIYRADDCRPPRADGPR